MAPKRQKSLAEQLADLDDPAPKDFDPEEEPEELKGSDDDEEADSDVDNEAARDHYVDVGKSKLRKRDQVALGPRYEGSSISRDAVADEDEDDPFSKGFDEVDSEEEDLGKGSALGENDEDDEDLHTGSDEGDDDMLDGDDTPASELDDDEEADDNSEVSDDEPTKTDDTGDRAQLRKLMVEEQKSVTATLSEAAKADAEKGRAVKEQRATFDALLNTRIKLQKALVGVNTITALSTDADATTSPPVDAYRAAEDAAFSLWHSLNNLRETIDTARTGRKRKHSEFSTATPTADLWSHMRAQEVEVKPHRNAILERWSAKTRSEAANALVKNRINNTASTQTIVDVLQEQLSNPERLVKRTRTPRSCAPLQVSRKVIEDDKIYDDADFYGLLLQSLLEQRSADSVAASASNIDVSFQMRREAKTKKNVDTKASKGRKLRYTVHEKLQNFMAPEDRSEWGERQVDDLFGSLFGRKMGLGEEDEDEMDGVEAEGDAEEAGLMLFRR